MRTFEDIMKRLDGDHKTKRALLSFNMTPQRKGGAVSVRKLADDLGLSVYEVELPHGVAGRLVDDPMSESMYAIEVNKSQKVTSKRFTVLHEIGHFLFHLDRSDVFAEPMYLDRGAGAFYFNPGQEAEANRFAEEIVFGNNALEGVYPELLRRLDQIAHFFGMSERVTEIAMRRRRMQMR